MFSILFDWPDQLPSLPYVDPKQECCRLIRLGEYLKAEATLLALQAEKSDSELALLLAYLYLLRANPDAAKRQLIALANQALVSPIQQAWFRALQLEAQLMLQQDASALLADLSYWQAEQVVPPLCLAHSALLLSSGSKIQALELLNKLPDSDCLEAVRLQALAHKQAGNFSAAIDLLQSALVRAPHLIGLHHQYIDVLVAARNSALVIPSLRSALDLHGEDPRLLAQVTLVKLLQRHPGLALRSSLLTRTWASVQKARMDVSNLINAYEQCGNSEWLENLLPLAQIGSFEIGVMENLNMQLASIESTKTPGAIAEFRAVVEQSSVFTELRRAPADFIAKTNISSSESLTIAWISADICHHPVARFLLSFFEASKGLRQHRHILVDTQDHAGESIASHFRALPDLTVINVPGGNKDTSTRFVRDLQVDIAIDLSGWTGANFLTGFMARLAPLQINYLGYFASTGIPEMDYWLGDRALFPEPIHEWHSETIHRLSRCFIAWQPSNHFPEASIDVTSAPSGGIRFGSFNHNRKLSNATLELWGQMLESIPGSSLVLKANANSDGSTQVLLRRRMLRNGLNPERVIWLPLAPTSRDHLHQYAQIDIALDCFPNGGCTTTCEALWMGVPVITLTGRSYVSRMSTAVLHGAGLPEWCVASPQAYLDLAIAQAGELSRLRQSRHHWRRQVQTNPLGDAADLMQHLEGAFSALYQQRCAALAASR